METTTPEITTELLQQHPLLIVAILALMGIVLLLTVGSLATWIFLIVRRVQGHAILSTDPWRPRAWGLVDILVILVLFFIFQYGIAVVGPVLLGIDVAAARESGQTPLSFAALSSLMHFPVMAIGCLWIAWRLNVSWAHIGFTKNATRVLKVGLLGGLAMLPLVYAGNAFVSLFSGVEYNHPLLDAMTKDGTPNNYLFAVFAAVIAAPFAEEFLFRGILQGFLQSIPFRLPIEILIGRREQPEPYPVLALDGVAELNLSGMPDGGTMAGSSEAFVPSHSSGSANPYDPPVVGALEMEQSVESDLSDSDSDVLPPIWPSIVAGTLFGLAHYGYGLSWIPLSLFGIGLGLLYRATHSIWPCIIVHFMMNGSSMVALGVTLYIHAVAG